MIRVGPRPDGGRVLLPGVSVSIPLHRSSRRLSHVAAVLTILAALLLPATASADTLTLTSGRTFEGRLIEQTDETVVFEIQQYGATMRQTYARERVANVVAVKRTGVGIAVLPMVGSIGAIPDDDTEACVTAAGVDAAMDAARAAGATQAVLLIDSPGGRIDEMVKIIAVLQRDGQLPVTAYVRRGISAAAIIALSCDKLVVAPGATLGAAVPLQIGPDGTPRNVEAKYRSAYLATIKQTARAAGRPPAVLLAMADERTVLYRVHGPNGREMLSDKRIGNAAVYKPAGEILTLTGREALEFGVARAAAEGLNDVPGAVGVDAWHSVGKRPWHVLKNAGVAARAAQQREIRGLVKGAVAPVLDDLRLKRDQVTRRIDAVEAYRKQLDKELARGRERLSNARRNRLWSARQAAVFRDQIEADHAAGHGEADAALLELRVALADLDDAIKQAQAFGRGG